MMVDPVSFHPLRRTTVATDRPVSHAAPKASRQGPELSSTPSLPALIGMAQDLAEAGPPIDNAKIAQIRQAIAQGDYTIDADAIADALLTFGRASAS